MSEAYITCTCTDVDECAEDTDECTQLCTDTEGSYFCSCEAGYDLAEDQHGCVGEIIKCTMSW